MQGTPRQTDNKVSAFFFFLHNSDGHKHCWLPAPKPIFPSSVPQSSALIYEHSSPYNPDWCTLILAAASFLSAMGPSS